MLCLWQCWHSQRAPQRLSGQNQSLGMLRHVRSLRYDIYPVICESKALPSGKQLAMCSGRGTFWNQLRLIPGARPACLMLWNHGRHLSPRHKKVQWLLLNLWIPDMQFLYSPPSGKLDCLADKRILPFSVSCLGIPQWLPFILLRLAVCASLSEFSCDADFKRTV